MNHVLAAYYGTAPVEKTSEAGASEALQLRELFVRLDGETSLEKVSSEADRRPAVRRLVAAFGGPELAAQKLSEAQDWMTAWDEGERDGRLLAAAAMQDLVTLHEHRP